MVLLKQTWAVMVVLSWGSTAIAGNCLPPALPWMSTGTDDVRTNADLFVEAMTVPFGRITGVSSVRVQKAPNSISNALRFSANTLLPLSKSVGLSSSTLNLIWS